MKPKFIQSLSNRPLAFGLAMAALGSLLQSAPGATFTWGRGVAGSFSWDNSSGVTAGESGVGANGNWNAGNGTVAGTNFPGAAGDIANLNNGTSATQTINLDRNITLGQLVLGNASGNTNTRTIASGGAGAFVLTMNNGAADASISQTSTSTGNITAAVVIGGNGGLVLSNSSTGQLNINSGITSGLTTGTQTISKSGSGVATVNSVIGNGSSGGTVAVNLTAGSLNLNSANTYTGATTITAGTLTLGGTAGALAASSAITNNGTFAVARTNTVVQGTDFSGSSITGTGALSATGTGLHLTLNTANGYQGITTIGAAANNSVVRATATGALGSGTIQFDSTGNASTARLELSGGITLSNPTIQFSARNNATAGIQNLSGNNELSGALNLQSGGSSHIVQSDAGLLTLSGSIANALGTGTRTLTLTGDGDGAITGAIGNGTGTTAVSKSGGGTWTLTNTHGYTGATGVSAGTLVINGNISTSSLTTVSGTGTLEGTGQVGALEATSGGTVAPGSSPGILYAGNTNLGSGSTLAIEINGNTVGSGYDQLNVSGTVTLAGLLDVSLGYTPVENSLFFILANNDTDAVSGTFSGLSNESWFSVGSQLFRISYFGDTASNSFTGGNDVVLMAVPEPGAALLGGLGALALLRRRRR